MKSREVLSAPDLASIVMETVVNGVIMPVVILCVSFERCSPWTALSISCILPSMTVWVCTLAIWLWTGGASLWTYRGIPVSVAILSTFTWCSVGYAATSSVRPRVRTCLHALAERGAKMPGRLRTLGMVGPRGRMRDQYS